MHKTDPIEPQALAAVGSGERDCVVAAIGSSQANSRPRIANCGRLRLAPAVQGLRLRL